MLTSFFCGEKKPREKGEMSQFSGVLSVHASVINDMAIVLDT